MRFLLLVLTDLINRTFSCDSASLLCSVLENIKSFYLFLLYKPIISRTTRSAIFTAPTSTSILKTSSPT